MIVACSEPGQRQIEERARSLVIINWVAFGLHAVLALSALISTIDKGSVIVPVFWPQANWNMTQCALRGYGRNTQICPSTSVERRFGDVNFSLVLIFSQSITCCFHALQAMFAGNVHSVYIKWSITRGIKLLHWIEYTFTASLIAHVILYFSGMLSIRTQVLGYAAQSTLMLIGLLQDILRYCAHERILEYFVVRVLVLFSFLIGFFNVCSVWFPSIYSLFVDSGDATPPAFVKWVVLSEFLLYSSFGIVQFLFFYPFLINGSTSTSYFYYEELALCVLSFIAKATLASVFSICLVYQQCN